MGKKNSYIEEEQTTQWSKEEEQKDKQRSTKHTYKTKDRVTQNLWINKNVVCIDVFLLAFPHIDVDKENQSRHKKGALSKYALYD